MKNLVDIIRYIVNNIVLSIVVNSTDGTRIFVCDTKDITLLKIVKDALGNEYRVTAFMLNEWVDVVPIGASPLLFSGNVLIAPTPLYLHGSPSSVNNEYLLIDQKTTKKTPFIWLLESFEYTDLPKDSSVEAKYDVRLFFLDWADEAKWTNDQHNDYVIKPIENLIRMFEQAIEEDYTFKRLGPVSKRPRSRFGVEITNKGSDKKIIQEDLSGVEVNLTLEVYDTSACLC
jgi:hypothetical protein